MILGAGKAGQKTANRLADAEFGRQPRSVRMLRPSWPARARRRRRRRRRRTPVRLPRA